MFSAGNVSQKFLVNSIGTPTHLRHEVRQRLMILTSHIWSSESNTIGLNLVAPLKKEIVPSPERNTHHNA